jgi:hypothetical protein
LVRTFLIGIVLILIPLLWLFGLFSKDMGVNTAEAIMVLGFIIIFMLLGVGIAFWYLVDNAIRQRKSIFRSDDPGKLAFFLIQIMGYGFVEEEAQIEVADSYEIIECPPLQCESHKRPRLGRKPNYPLERWLPIAQKWENRDPLVDAFTLGELIAEHLGTHPNGSPIMTEQSYYSTWRDLAVAELEKREALKKEKRLAYKKGDE